MKTFIFTVERWRHSPFLNQLLVSVYKMTNNVPKLVSSSIVYANESVEEVAATIVADKYKYRRRGQFLDRQDVRIIKV